MTARSVTIDDDFEVTDEHVAALRAEAGAAGDFEQVRICEAALTGDKDARAECERIIRGVRIESAE